MQSSKARNTEKDPVGKGKWKLPNNRNEKRGDPWRSFICVLKKLL